MPIIKSFSVGPGDTCYIQHGSDNFTIIDCDLNQMNAEGIIDKIKAASAHKGIVRFISTHPDDDHFGGIELLDDALGIRNFYVVKNDAQKDPVTTSFERYCQLRDGKHAFYIHKGCKRKWMNLSDDQRKTSGLEILWPDRSNVHFKNALAECNAGTRFNDISAVIQYRISGGASFLWLGDLTSEFMDNISDDIELSKTTVVFAAHHGRKSGKIPDSWLERLDPQIIIIGEAPSRHLHYYTGYKTITQNSAGDITMDCVGDKVHFYASSAEYTHDGLTEEGKNAYDHYIGSITVETEYTL